MHILSKSIMVGSFFGFLLYNIGLYAQNRIVTSMKDN